MKKSLSFLEINKTYLLHNIEEFKRRNTTQSKMIIPVKANAYGHGLREVVEILQDHVHGFQVDGIEEFLEARQYTDNPLYVFGYVLDEDLNICVTLGAILGVYSLDQLRLLDKIGEKAGKKIIVHIKIDALLGRQGFLPDEIEKVLKEAVKLEYVDVAAIYSHFSDIEDVDNIVHAKKQYDILMKVKELFKKGGYRDIQHHISATSGLLTDLDLSWQGSFTRLGIGTYGLWPSNNLKRKRKDDITLKPVMRWITHIAQVKLLPANHPVGYGQTFITERPTSVAIIPQGYADGFDRKFSNNGEVLIHGKRCPVLGRVAMNMFVVDVSHLSDVQREDEVVIMGRQKKEEISAEKLAEKIETINYEIVARLDNLLPRQVIVK